MEMDMKNHWRKNSIAMGICEGIMVLAMLYLFVYNGESSVAWTAFFIGLMLTILFHIIDEKNNEIELLRSGKEPTPEPTRQHLNDPHSYDPFYISDANNPNLKKLKDGNGDGDDLPKNNSSTKL